jgi:translation initiation factor 5
MENDPFYRYKLPPLIAKLEGKGNGMKTVLVNIEDISKLINRLPTNVVKFFSYELGVQSMYKHKVHSLNGNHTSETLQIVFNKFMSLFVSCSECTNPETILCIHGRKQYVLLDCTACGQSRNIIANHKLSTFLIKGAQNRKKVQS